MHREHTQRGLISDATMASDSLQRCHLSSVLQRAYRFHRLRKLSRAVACRLEGDHFYSVTLREIFNRYHGVQIGAYSYGECFVPGAFAAGVTVGRYVSVASGVRVFLRNHPMERLSMHPFFYNAELGCLGEDSIETSSLQIGHDSWLGFNAIVTPGCSTIGVGAVVAAGAVVTKDVPDFAIVGGNPARIIRYRFPDHVCEAILASRWWEHPLKDCVNVMPAMITPLPNEITQHPLLSKSRGTQFATSHV